MARSRDSAFTVYMFQSDFDRIKNWVLQYPDRETGGDLFGLWSTGDNSVIHITLGPGQNCKHGDYHFYQDVPYLERVGNLLTNDYMLGHIGEWHSHHQLALDEPSEGDCKTIARNFPRGSCGFILMIANIITREDVSINPYLFKEGYPDYIPGQIDTVDGKSPFRNVPNISSVVEQGLEDKKDNILNARRAQVRSTYAANFK